METKHYIENDPNKMILRDHLAFDRTVLAVERTILAYVRTALVSFGAGITIVKLFPEDTLLVVIAWISFLIAFISTVLGFLRFIKIRKELRDVYKSVK